MLVSFSGGRGLFFRPFCPVQKTPVLLRKTRICGFFCIIFRCTRSSEFGGVRNSNLIWVAPMWGSPGPPTGCPSSLSSDRGGGVSSRADSADGRIAAGQDARTNCSFVRARAAELYTNAQFMVCVSVFHHFRGLQSPRVPQFWGLSFGVCVWELLVCGSAFCWSSQTIPLLSYLLVILMKKLVFF